MRHDSGVVPAVKRYKYEWSLRGIQWRLVWKYQHWGALLLLIPAAVLTGVAHWQFQKTPVVRQALLYDATISYPQATEQTIANWLATLLNWICQLLAVLMIELIIFRRQHSLTVAICGIIHHIWCCLVSFVIIVCITEITKPFSGRLRPDFLSRCRPADAIDPASGFSTFITDHAASLGPVHFGQLASPCTNPNDQDIKDGRLSFPSGHASNSMSVAWYTSLYLMWSLYLRVDNPYPKKLYVATTLRGRLGQEILYALAYAFLLLVLCLSWFIGMTRFWDNVHNVSDIIGGFLLAIIFSTPFVIKAIGLHIAFRNQIDTGEAAADAARSNTVPSTVFSPAGPASYGAQPDHLPITYSDVEPGVDHPPVGLQPTGVGNGGPRSGAVNGGDVVLQMSGMPRR